MGLGSTSEFYMIDQSRQKPPSNNQPLVDINEAFSSEELLALCRRIISAGVLGRSKHYSALLEYLVQCSLKGKIPKEIKLPAFVYPILFTLNNDQESTFIYFRA